MEGPMCWEGKTGFGVQVRLREVPYHTGFPAVVVVTVLSEGDMHSRRPSPELDIANRERSVADGGAPEERQMQGDRVRLVAGGMGGGEMEGGGGEEAGGYEAAVGDFAFCQISSV